MKDKHLPYLLLFSAQNSVTQHDQQIFPLLFRGVKGENFLLITCIMQDEVLLHLNKFRHLQMLMLEKRMHFTSTNGFHPPKESLILSILRILDPVSRQKAIKISFSFYLEFSTAYDSASKSHEEYLHTKKNACITSPQLYEKDLHLPMKIISSFTSYR